MTAGLPKLQSETRATSASCRCERSARGMQLSTSRTITNVRAFRGWMVILLLGLALLLLGGVRPAQAQSATCDGTPYLGVVDGNAYPTPPNLLQIDGACTIQNYPASNPYTGSISWLSTNNTLLIFNNVVFNGNMSCDSHEHGDFVWFVNGSITRQHILNCSNLFAPVDKIDKQNPPGPPVVSIGVPFTYTLTFPQQASGTTGAVVNPNGSSTEVDQVTVTDNLNATGVSLSYVSSSAAWKGSGGAIHRHERGGPAHLQRLPCDPGRAADRAESHRRAQQRRAAELARHAVLEHGHLDAGDDHRRDLPLPAAGRSGGLAAADHCNTAHPGHDQGWPGDDEPRAVGAVHSQRAEHRHD